MPQPEKVTDISQFHSTEFKRDRQAGFDRMASRVAPLTESEEAAEYARVIEQEALAYQQECEDRDRQQRVFAATLNRRGVLRPIPLAAYSRDLTTERTKEHHRAWPPGVYLAFLHAPIIKGRPE